MKAAFYLENGRTACIDLRRPELGNPGCGGTQYMFALVPYLLSVEARGCVEPLVLANDVTRLPKGVSQRPAESAEEAVHRAADSGADVFIYRPRRNVEDRLLQAITERRIRTIAWLHITPKDDHIRALAKCPYVAAAVCVEHEQHDLIFDSPLWRKLTYIVNPFLVDDYRLADPPRKERDLVVFLGALVPQKGFHLLARAWPDIRARRPTAKLEVIGTGDLYGPTGKAGPLGVADDGYERREILPHLEGKNGLADGSVKFLGRLGLEKKSILHRAAVGVVNPSGQTENCPGSALEFQACGTPVVAGAYYGMLDTVRHNKTGMLAGNPHQFTDYLTQLLKDPDRCGVLGKAGESFVRDRYDPKKVCVEWCELLARIVNSESIQTGLPKANIWKHHKLIILANCIPQRIIGSTVKWPTVAEVKAFLIRVRNQVRGRLHAGHSMDV